MFRGLFLIVIALLACLGMLAGVIGISLHRIDQARKTADAAWRPPPAPATAPATDPSASADEPADPEPATQPNGSIELWAKDAVTHGKVILGDSAADHGNAEKASREASERARLARLAKDIAREANADPVTAERLRTARIAREAKMAERRRQREAMASRPPAPYLSGFHDPDDYVEWEVELPKAGDYEIDMTYACPNWKEGGRFILRLADKELPVQAETTKHSANFRVVTVGTIKLPAGKTTLILRPAEKGPRDQSFINLRNVQIIPAS